MTGRQWRHFCVEWPHMVAGLFGPAVCRGIVAPLNQAPPSLQANLPRGHPADADMDDGWGDGTYEEVCLEMEELARPVEGVDTSAGSPYYSLFGEVPIEDAVLRMFCVAAKVNGLFFMGTTGRTTLSPPSRRRWRWPTWPRCWGI